MSTIDKHISDCILVSVDFSDHNEGVLIVGRKRKNETAEIINAFQGKEAMDLYKKLITKEKKDAEN